MALLGTSQEHMLACWVKFSTHHDHSRALFCTAGLSTQTCGSAAAAAPASFLLLGCDCSCPHGSAYYMSAIRYLHICISSLVVSVKQQTPALIVIALIFCTSSAVCAMPRHCMTYSMCLPVHCNLHVPKFLLRYVLDRKCVWAAP